MQLWIDAQLPPSIATSFRRVFSVDAKHVLELGLVGSNDERIYEAARLVDAIVVTKDSDFVRILERVGPPPKILWITMGNATNAALWQALERHWPRAESHFAAGEPLVEIGRAT